MMNASVSLNFMPLKAKSLAPKRSRATIGGVHNMIKHTYKTIAEKLERLGTSWDKCKMAYYHIFTHKPYWAVKVPCGHGDYLTLTLDHRSIGAIERRISRAMPRQSNQAMPTLDVHI